MTWQELITDITRTYKLTGRQLAAKIGVSSGTVSNIKSGGIIGVSKKTKEGLEDFLNREIMVKGPNNIELGGSLNVIIDPPETVQMVRDKTEEYNSKRNIIISKKMLEGVFTLFMKEGSKAILKAVPEGFRGNVVSFIESDLKFRIITYQADDLVIIYTSEEFAAEARKLDKNDIFLVEEVVKK